jgi:DNA polymerase-3 subunit delta'
MSFQNFPEQRAGIELLQRSLARGRLGHAYLFSGDSLDSMSAVARTLAKALNCQNPPARSASGIPLDSCDQCLSCRKTESEIHPDVQWIRPESKSRQITIDQMRELMQIVNLKPTEAPHKVGIIVAADRVNTQASNAFLKTLEEPPPRSVLILITTAPDRLLETILSRCLRLKFAAQTTVSLGAPTMAWLSQFAQAAAQNNKSLISRYKLLGLIAARLTALKEDVKRHLTAKSPLQRYDDIDPKLREKWEEELDASIEAEYRRQRSELVLALQWWMRDVWLLGGKRDQALLSFRELIEISRTLAVRIGEDKAAENLRGLETLQRLFNTNAQEALVLEVGVLKLKL